MTYIEISEKERKHVKKTKLVIKKQKKQIKKLQTQIMAAEKNAYELSRSTFDK